jgi:hypothetical protein
MLTKTAMAISVAIVFGAVSTVPAMSHSSKARAARAAVQPSNPISHSAFWSYGRPRGGNPGFNVYDTTGRYLGSDPDPLVRLDLVRNPPGRY